MNSYKFDTHVHTSETSGCGKISGSSLVHLYKQSGYHGVIITDHYFKEYFDCMGDISWENKISQYLIGYKNALAEGQKIGFNVLLGMEIRFTENPNDYLVFGIDEAFLIENKMLYNLSLNKFRNFTKDNGILIYQAHPFRAHITPANPLLLDGVEIFNGNLRHNSHNDMAAEFAKNNGLKLLSGSDFHEDEDLARGGIVISENINTSKDFVRVLSENKIIELISPQL